MKLTDLGKGLAAAVTEKIENIDTEAIKNKVEKIKGTVEDVVNTAADKLSDKLDERYWNKNTSGTIFGNNGGSVSEENMSVEDIEAEKRKLAIFRFQCNSRHSILTRIGITDYQKEIFINLIDSQFYNSLGLTNTQFNQLLSKLTEFSNQQACKRIFLILDEIEKSENGFSEENIFESLMTIVSADKELIDHVLYEYLKEEKYGLSAKELSAFNNKVLNYNVQYLFIDEEHDDIIEKINDFSEYDEKALDDYINFVERIKISDENRGIEATESLAYRAIKAMAYSEAEKRKEDLKTIINSFNDKCNNELKRNIFDNFMKFVVKNSISIEKVKSISEIILAIPEEKITKIDSSIAESMFNFNLLYLLNSDKTEDYLRLVFDPSNSSNTIASSYNLCTNRSFVDTENGRQLLFDISMLTIKDNKDINKNLIDLLNNIFSNLNFDKVNMLNDNPLETLSKVVSYIHLSIKASKKSLTQEEYDFIEEEVAPYIIDRLDLLKNTKTKRQIVKIYDSFYEMNSYILENYPNCNLTLYGYASDNDRKDLKSSLLINRNDESLLIYSAKGELLSKLNVAFAEQSISVIKCSEEITAKYPSIYHLIAKYKDKCCSIPVTSNKNVNDGVLNITLPDNTMIQVNLNNSTIVEVDPGSEIMNDITKQIIGSKGIVLRQF